MDQGKALFMRAMLTKRSNGFTIPELIVVLTVLGVLIGLIFGPFDDLYWANAQSLQTIVQTTDTRSALRQIEREITISKGFLKESAMDINSDTPYVNGTNKWTWDGTGTPSVDSPKNVLITENYATRGDTGDIVRAADCATPLTVNYVFFVYGNTLYRRALVNPTICSTDGVTADQLTQQRTCYSVSLNTSCKGRDAKIITDVDSFTISYFTKSIDKLEDARTGSDAPTGAWTVVLELTTKNKNGLKSTATMRITRMNGSGS